ncbi:MAG TPA: aminotransferase class V-fold PLP-dependent enzyme [Cyclobacteriaceae bacterium]|jgi:selenocysteine lyase/cysteine desulfurase|nr:aminotransferase class V-fold PLP-dependent enzyme [Cytophagales bacterium]HRE68056.1 aminotransferase class V-fold PLP-dependent enzyme [Cyclobacteriaceae bacterium]HRF34645.1 aminotransferase class V-fold PLP-dependent enzyme [Cyclobacteriaceae bacterium]
MDINFLRHQTPGCKSKIHFNNAGASLPPQQVVETITEHLTLEATTGGYEAADLKKNEIAGFYHTAAKLLNCKASNIAFTSSATNSFARALSCIPFNPGDSLLLANEDYISNQLAFLSLQKRFGIKIVRAASLPKGGVDVDDMRRLMDLHKPKLVSLTHVPSNTGLIQPVEAVGELCAERDIYYLVDGCQSAGQLPTDVQQIKCDFFTATLRKFLRGPRGAGFLYVSNKVIERKLEPLFIDLRGAEWIKADEYAPRMDALRFEDWELPYPLVMGSKAAIDLAVSLGLNEIQKRNTTLCNLIKTGLAALPHITLLDKGTRQSSIITIKFNNNLKGTDVLNTLRAKNINTSIGYRNFALIDFDAKQVDWALRISPHYYNTEEEVTILLNAITKLVA